MNKLTAAILGASVAATVGFALPTAEPTPEYANRTSAVSYNVKHKATTAKVNRAPAWYDARIGYPPYWHELAPSTCQEDMICWIGSTEDSRSDNSSYNDWRYQIFKGLATSH